MMIKKADLLLCCALGLSPIASAQQLSGAGAPVAVPVAAQEDHRISLKAFVALIAYSDEMVRSQRLEETIAGHGVRGAQGIFEPFFSVGLEREDMSVLNSAQDAVRRGLNPLDPSTLFVSHENRLKAAVGVKTSSGADFELSYNISSLWDSLQTLKAVGGEVISPEKKGYLGIKLTQPLMRGAGSDVNRLGIVIAESEQSVARETLRQLLAQRVMEGLQTYIFVQRAEERVRLRTEARDVAGEIERSVAEQSRAGLRSAAELMEARSSLALRQAQLAQAQQELAEQQNALQIYVSARDRASGSILTGSALRPADALVLAQTEAQGAVAATAGTLDGDSLVGIMARRPEARVNVIKMERENHRVKVALDQVKPELNLMLSYGKDALSGSFQSLAGYFGGDVPYNHWTAGLTYKVGVFGDERRSSEYQAAIARREQSELALSALRQRIANEVLSSSAVLGKALQQVARQEEIVTAQRNLLSVERELLREGRRATMDVLKRQLELLLAEEALADSVTQANRASYLTLQVQGNLLSRLGLE